jgi:cyclophilin family peptidyl-prolyl cis-trans isomerase
MKKLVQMLCGFCLAFAFQATALAQTITNQPQSITINNASTATFTVGASNATSYQWQFNGSNLTDVGNITGSATSALTLEDVNTNQAGNYTVVVNGSVTNSHPAVLTIVPGTIVRFIFTNFLGGGTSNVDVQLFNHDKPVTVQNFIHYITAGAYTNMFFDRCIPEFVLQGGDYGASNQTMSTPPITGWSIERQFTGNDTFEPLFPPQIDSEFNVGPLIHNRFGTIAMALESGDPNSASSAFFFNLADNSTNLDFQNGGFTVFGRILDGTNVLQYFNGLTNGNGIITNGEFSDDGSSITLPNLPVNYPGTNAPANANLVFCTFQLTNPPGATNLPAVSITSPTTNALWSNSVPLTIQGTAIDTNDIGLAWVRCDLIPLAAADGTLPNGGVSLTNFVLGATNWNLGFGIVAPGMYKLGAQVQDEASNLSTEVFVQPVTITAFITNGNGTVTFTNGVFSNLNAVGYPFQDGTEYTVDATAATNQLFVNWTDAYGFNTINSEVSFTNVDGLLLTATFISNGIPDSIAFTHPASNAIISIGTFNITGTISNVPSNTATVTCQIYSAMNYEAVGPALTNSGTNTWSVAVSNLAVGPYIVEAIAVDLAGDRTMITNNFTVSTNASLKLIIVGSGTVSPVTNGEPILVGTSFQVTATPNAEQSIYSWSNGITGSVSLNPVQTYTMIAGLTLTATFVTNNFPNMIAFTDPAQNGIVGPNNFIIAGTISTNVLSTPVTVSCQVFSKTNSLLFSQPLKTTGTQNWMTGLRSLPLGPYTLLATAVDPAGNGALISEDFTVSTNVPLQLNIAGPGTVSPVTVTNGELIVIGTMFQATATPKPGQLFYSWSNGITHSVSLNPAQTFTMTNGLALTATFVTNNFPNMIAFTDPAPNAIVGSNDVIIAGTISTNILSLPVTVSCQIFSKTNSLAISQVLTTAGTNNWTIILRSLPVGSYTILAKGLDPAGDSTLISEDFTVAYAANLSLIIVGTGTVSPVTNGESLPIGTNFQVTATPSSGQVFYTWNNGTQISANATQTYTMASGLTLTATFIPSNTAKGISFTYPAANARLSTNTFPLRGKIATGFKPAVITCQVFQTNGLAIGPPLTTSGKTTWAVTITNLPGGNYTVEAAATNPAGMSTIISENFSVLPFAATTGTYSGLFICTNSPVAPTNSGFLTFTLTPSGTFSGKLIFPAYPAIPIYSLSFENIDFTTGYVPFGFTNYHGEPLSGAIYLDLIGGTDVALGTISSDAWSSQLICYRAVTKLSTNTMPATGKYILSLQPENQTNKLSTNGYASLVIAKGGNMALSGSLPDDTTFSQSARVSKDGVWPFYVIPTGNKTNGMLMGWETNSASGDCSGQLYWHKAPHIGAYYTGGVGVVSNMLVNSTGTNYSRPAAGSQYSIIFEGGTIVPPLTNTLMVNEAGQFAVSDSPPDKLKISLSANGVITGSVLNTNDNKTLRFKGAFISPSQGGSGFIPDAGGQTGCFELELEPP